MGTTQHSSLIATECQQCTKHWCHLSPGRSPPAAPGRPCCCPQVLRRAAELAGAGPRHGAREVVAGVWGRVDVPTFLEACSQVGGGGGARGGVHARQERASQTTGAP